MDLINFRIVLRRPWTSLPSCSCKCPSKLFRQLFSDFWKKIFRINLKLFSRKTCFRTRQDPTQCCVTILSCESWIVFQKCWFLLSFLFHNYPENFENMKQLYSVFTKLSFFLVRDLRYLFVSSFWFHTWFLFQNWSEIQEIWNSFEVCFQSYPFYCHVFLPELLRSCVTSDHLFYSSLPICTWFLFQFWSEISGNMKQFWSVFSKLFVSCRMYSFLNSWEVV